MRDITNPHIVHTMQCDIRNCNMGNCDITRDGYLHIITNTCHSKKYYIKDHKRFFMKLSLLILIVSIELSILSLAIDKFNDLESEQECTKSIIYNTFLEEKSKNCTYMKISVFEIQIISSLLVAVSGILYYIAEIKNYKKSQINYMCISSPYINNIQFY